MNIIKLEVFESSSLKSSSEQYINAEQITRIRFMDDCAMLFMNGNDVLYVGKSDALELIGAYNGKATCHIDDVECIQAVVVDDISEIFEEDTEEGVSILESEMNLFGEPVKEEQENKKLKKSTSKHKGD